MFKKLAGMTGTAKTDAKEFMDTYGLAVIKIPTNKTIMRLDQPDKVFVSNEAKIYASIERVKKAHAKGQPILVETGSVTMSELYSRILLREGIPHSLLNATSVAKEAQIIANAGQKNAITVATSMAGRGTDIKLGPDVAELGGLLVIGTERMTNIRIDNQLRGRSGRQGSLGESVFYVSLEDKVVLENGGKRVTKLRQRLSAKEARFGLAMTEITSGHLALKAVTKAQNIQKNQEIEERFQTLEYDQVLKSQRDELYRTRNEVISCKDYRPLLTEVVTSVAEQLINQVPLTIDTMTDFFYNNIDYDYQFDDEMLILIKQNAKHELQTLLHQKFNEAITRKLTTIPDASQRLYYERLVILKVLDEMWIEQVDHLQQLKTVISGRNWAQHNPFFEYQREAIASFETMKKNVLIRILRNLLLSELVENLDGTIDVEFP